MITSHDSSVIRYIIIPSDCHILQATRISGNRMGIFEQYEFTVSATWKGPPLESINSKGESSQYKNATATIINNLFDWLVRHLNILLIFCPSTICINYSLATLRHRIDQCLYHLRALRIPNLLHNLAIMISCFQALGYPIGTYCPCLCSKLPIP